ncbi:MAG: hypothetical protein HFJ09_14115 [Lachnospiraceae bacterium]|nr:hypothetical protein [Lachnospiraceae bacterium]
MAAKKKHLTQKEKNRNAEIKKELQEKGIIPQDKPRLNRKKFVDEAMEEWDNRPQCYIWEFYLIKALDFIVAKPERRNYRVSQEAVGAAKVLKLAIRLYQFSKKLEEEGRTDYKFSEQWEYIKDILDA